MVKIHTTCLVMALLVWLMPADALATLHPQQGRFMQRDPLGYVDGMGQYEYEGSAAPDDLDFTGLWTIKRQGSERWATAVMDKDSDTFATLARLVRLTYEERTQWLKKEVPGSDSFAFVSDSDTAKSGCTYSVPNVMAVYTSPKKNTYTEKWWGIFDAANNMRWRAERRAKAYANAGFMVVDHTNTANTPVFVGMWQEDGIYAVAFGGHSSATSGNLIEKTKKLPVPKKTRVFREPDVLWSGYVTGAGVAGPWDIKVPYKLGGIFAYSCGTDQSQYKGGWPPARLWREFVSSGGRFVGFRGFAKINSLPETYGDEDVPPNSD